MAAEPRRRRPRRRLQAACLVGFAGALAWNLSAGCLAALLPPGAPLPGRRAAAAAAAAGAALASGAAARAEGTVKLTRVIAESGLEDWTVDEYAAMRDDEPRTEGYEKAIQKRLAGKQGAVVVDIGTGSFALLAIMAAKAGASKVYAIEKNAAAVPLAREAVDKAGFKDKIEVIEGDSMAVQLPERVDLIVSELIGSIATQEGVEPIIKDAQRFLKEGLRGDSKAMVPQRVQTQIVPVKYTEHRIMKFAEKRGVMSRGKALDGTLRPLRLRGKTRDLVFLAEPQLLEDFDFNNPGATRSQEAVSLKFDIPANKADDAKDFSGFAMWTRLVIDDDVVVEVRGQKQTSHWAYVVALMADKPVAVPAPGTLELRGSVDYGSSPVRYTFETEVPA